MITLLGFLDLSAAFDTVDHDILIERLRVSFGLNGKVLQWLVSFVTGRRQAVVFNGQTAPMTDLNFGVPQGSVLGPLLFLLYTADVCDIAASHFIGNYAYADDHQIHIHCYPSDDESAIRRFQSCFLQPLNYG